MKKTCSVLLGLLLLAVPAAQAQFTYTTNNGAITLAYYTGAGGAVVISNFVTGIGDGAFRQCYSLASLTIPNSVTSVGVSAFDSCSSLTSLTIPRSVTSIGNYAFEFCNSLTNVTIANGVTGIGGWEFNGCSRLPNIIIPASVMSIGDYAFQHCGSLTGIYFKGNPPTADSTVFTNATTPQAVPQYDPATIYYLPGTAGWAAFSASTGLPAVLWNPGIQAAGASFGVQNGQFGFNVTNTANLTVVVEACTNLSNPVWFPLTTNTLVNGVFYFSEPLQSNATARFYGLGLP